MYFVLKKFNQTRYEVATCCHSNQQKVNNMIIQTLLKQLDNIVCQTKRIS